MRVYLGVLVFRRDGMTVDSGRDKGWFAWMRKVLYVWI